jgi:glucose-6-phosphate isomerase
VGLLPAALVGIDIEALLKGARRAVRGAESSRLLENSAALLSGLLWAADARQGARLHVLMTYSDRLREFAEWYQVITFIRVEDHSVEVSIPRRSGLPEDLAYLSELLGAEQEATAAALARYGRMNCTITLPRIDADVFGELLMFFQLATGYGGIWYGVNPFD